MDKKPSELWKDYLHANKSWDKAGQASFDLYLSKYAKHDKDNAPQEKFTDKFLLNGKIYTFLYTTNEKPTKARPFIDRRPLFISMGMVEKNGKMLETGIDLMVVPFKVRVFILDAIYKFYYKQIDENVSDIEEGRKGKKPLSLNYQVAKAIFNKMGWQMAYSLFDRSKMATIEVVDYQDWPALISLDTKSMQGKGLNEIYTEYIKKMTTSPDIPAEDRPK